MEFAALMKLPYLEFIAEALRDAPKDGTWREQSDWVKANYTPEQITAMYMKPYALVEGLSQNGKEELSDIDAIFDAMDVFWYAGDTDMIDKAMDEFLTMLKLKGAQ
jgi:hypothetical protein